MLKQTSSFSLIFVLAELCSIPSTRLLQHKFVDADVAEPVDVEFLHFQFEGFRRPPRRATPLPHLTDINTVQVKSDVGERGPAGQAKEESEADRYTERERERERDTHTHTHTHTHRETGRQLRYTRECSFKIGDGQCNGMQRRSHLFCRIMCGNGKLS